MAKIWQTKLPDGLDAAAEARISELKVSKYQYLQDLVMKDLSVIPPLPKKPPPPLPPKRVPPPLPKRTAPRVTGAARPVFEVIPRLNALAVNDCPRDEVWDALLWEAREGMDVLRHKSSKDVGHLTLQRLNELGAMILDLSLGQVLDTFQKGCLRAAEEEWRASLPKVRLGGEGAGDL